MAESGQQGRTDTHNPPDGRVDFGCKPCGVIGSGRMAFHFISYLSLSRIPFKQWSRKKNSDRELETFFSDCRCVLVLISDDAILPFIESHQFLKKMNPVHFSGSLYLPEVAGIHPLMTFSHEPYDLETYRMIPFVHERGRFTFRELFPSLSNPSAEIDPAMKPLYHSLCVMSGNFTTILWQKTMQDFEQRLGVSPGLVLPYMNRIFINLQSNPGNALTGPLARRDFSTIEMNMRALANDPFQEVYKAFVTAICTGDTK